MVPVAVPAIWVPVAGMVPVAVPAIFPVAGSTIWVPVAGLPVAVPAIFPVAGSTIWVPVAGLPVAVPAVTTVGLRLLATRGSAQALRASLVAGTSAAAVLKSVVPAWVTPAAAVAADLVTNPRRDACACAFVAACVMELTYGLSAKATALMAARFASSGG